MAIRVKVFEEESETLENLRNSSNVSDNWDVQQIATLSQLEHTILEGDEIIHVVIVDLDGAGITKPADINHLIHDEENTEWVFLYSDLYSNKALHNKFDKLENDNCHLLLKPVETDYLVKLIQRLYRAYRTSIKLSSFSKKEEQKYTLDSFMGTSQKITEVKELVMRLAEAPCSAITILGETGTGKGMTARILHHNGIKKDGPMVEINCAALPRELLESELFGHEAGAFTGAQKRYKGLFEQADGGTLFLDEIGDMDIELQSKLLKAIEDKKIRRLGSDREIRFDADIIAATSVNLLEACQENKFREDLYHRISTFIIDLPPLRERKEDLSLIIPATISEFNQRARKNIKTISDEAWDRLMNYSWPGNIREVRNVIERSVLLSKGDELPVQWLGLGNDDLMASNAVSGCSFEQAVELLFQQCGSLEEIQKTLIQTAMNKNKGNVSASASYLGLSREKLRYRLKKYDMG